MANEIKHLKIDISKRTLKIFKSLNIKQTKKKRETFNREK